MRSLLASLALVAGCTTPRLAAEESDIRGGTTDQGDPAVAALLTAGVSHCTATLIAPHTLLTAGHCNHSGIIAAFGTQSASPSQSIAVADAKVHPMYTGVGKPFDFALMKLVSDPTGIAPVMLNDTALTTADVGEVMRHVGFGVTDETTGAGRGTKRTVTYPLNRIDSMLIYSGAPGKQTCSGDSGGPAFMQLTGQLTETLVGVVSDGPSCNLSQDGWDDRVDMVKDWIVQTVSAWDAPPSFGGGSGSGGDPGGTPPDAGVVAADGGDGNGATGAPAAGGCAAGDPAASWPLCALVGLLFLRRRRKRALVAASVLVAACSRAPSQKTGTDAHVAADASSPDAAGDPPGIFSLALIPDTQSITNPDSTAVYTMVRTADLESMTQWIADTAVANNTKMALSMGDLVEWGAKTPSWSRAQDMMRNLASASNQAKRVQYGVIAGNHDIDNWSSGGTCGTQAQCGAANDSITILNTYFPWTDVANQTSFDGAAPFWFASYPAATSDNTAFAFRAGNINWLIVMLKFPYSESATSPVYTKWLNGPIAWARQLIANEQEKKVIIVTHDCLTPAGNRSNAIETLLWDNLSKSYPNVAMVLCGHYDDRTQPNHTTFVGTNGNTVHHVVTDFQYGDQATDLDTYEKLMTFSPDDGTVAVQTYSPPRHEFLTDSSHAFTISNFPFANTSPSPDDFTNDNYALHGTVTASSSYESPNWGAAHLTDGWRGSVSGKLGYLSDPQTLATTNEWVKVDLTSDRPLHKLYLFPRNDRGCTGTGYPVDFTIETATDSAPDNWTTVSTKTGQTKPAGDQPLVYPLSGTARYVRVNASKLGPACGTTAYDLSLSELEVF